MISFFSFLTVTATCESVVQQNNTNFRNRDFPSGFNPSGLEVCNVRVQKVSKKDLKGTTASHNFPSFHFPQYIVVWLWMPTYHWEKYFHTKYNPAKVAFNSLTRRVCLCYDSCPRTFLHETNKERLSPLLLTAFVERMSTPVRLHKHAISRRWYDDRSVYGR